MQYMFCWSERKPADSGEVLGPILIMLTAAAISFSLSGNITISFNKHSLMFCEQNRNFFLFNLQNDENVNVF